MPLLPKQFRPALHEIGRMEGTLYVLAWFEDPALRRRVTAALIKERLELPGSRAVFFNSLVRFIQWILFSAASRKGFSTPGQRIEAQSHWRPPSGAPAAEKARGVCRQER